MPDPDILEGSQEHGLVDIVLRVVGLLLQLAWLQGLRVVRIRESLTQCISTSGLRVFHQLFPATHVDPVGNATVDQSSTLRVQLGFLVTISIAIGS